MTGLAYFCGRTRNVGRNEDINWRNRLQMLAYEMYKTVMGSGQRGHLNTFNSWYVTEMSGSAWDQCSAAQVS